MNIPSSQYLKNKAANRLQSGKDPQKVLLVYAAISLASSLVVTAVRYALNDRIGQTGGLSNIGLRSILTTADNVLPILQTVLMMCLTLGYTAAMLRIARRQYASPQTLKVGAARFWQLLRTQIIMGLMYSGVFFASFYIGLGLFMVSPMSNAFIAQAKPLLESGILDNPQLLAQQPEALEALMVSLRPMLIMCLLAAAILAIPLFYRYRLVSFILVDKPMFGALMAMKQSSLLMKGNVWKLMKLDLSFWWFYLLQLIITALAYLDTILAMIGIVLPVSFLVAFFGSFLLYLAADFAVLYFFKNRVSVTYALFYDALSPMEKPEGAVLGNIFQM